MIEQGALFGASSFCGHEDPERPGWQCVHAPDHEGYPHVYGRGIRMGTVPRQRVSKGSDAEHADAEASQ